MAKQPRSLYGQVAAITGAARGIGRATLEVFLAEGLEPAGPTGQRHRLQPYAGSPVDVIADRLPVLVDTAHLEQARPESARPPSRNLPPAPGA